MRFCRPVFLFWVLNIKKLGPEKDPSGVRLWKPCRSREPPRNKLFRYQTPGPIFPCTAGTMDFRPGTSSTGLSPPQAVCQVPTHPRRALDVSVSSLSSSLSGPNFLMSRTPEKEIGAAKTHSHSKFPINTARRVLALLLSYHASCSGNNQLC